MACRKSHFPGSSSLFSLPVCFSGGNRQTALPSEPVLLSTPPKLAPFACPLITEESTQPSWNPAVWIPFSSCALRYRSLLLQLISIGGGGGVKPSLFTRGQYMTVCLETGPVNRAPLWQPDILRYLSLFLHLPCLICATFLLICLPGGGCNDKLNSATRGDALKQCSLLG